MAGRGKSQKSLALIDAAKRILKEIQPASVRAVCYRLFVEGLIPSMETKHTQRVSVQLVDARENGVIPWQWIVDETRSAETISTWRDPQAIFNACINSYRLNYWKEQPNWIEVWSEKGTVRGTLAPILDKYGITFRVLHGFASATVLHDIAADVENSYKKLTVLYVGDRDPSGMHMSKVDLPGRLARYGDGELQIVRVAITEADTTAKANVPSFAAKSKSNDRRYQWFVENYGPRCWELDALSPVILRRRVEAAIVRRLDRAAWAHAEMIEAAQRESMRKYLSGYNTSISRQVQKYERPKLSTRPRLTA